VTDLVALDVGGTHARFALAKVGADGTIALAEPVTLATGDYAGLAEAWAEFERATPGPIPRVMAIAAAGPVIGATIPLTNSQWVIDAAELREKLGIEQVTLINDFGAVAHAVARVPADQLVHIAGPDRPLPEHGTVSVIGPGTGLGVAYIHRHRGGWHVQSTEGGHIGFAPQDEFDDGLVAALREKHGRVVTERVNAGPGIAAIYSGLGGSELTDDRTIWQRGIAREDKLAATAVDRFCASLGSVAGDYALVHGASAVVLAGGIGLKLRDLLPRSDFATNFCAKPRYETMMASMPIKLIVHPQPGLYGAAAAFAMEHRI
jgi:glucokinase